MNIYETEKCAKCGDYPLIYSESYFKGRFFAWYTHYCINGRKYHYGAGAETEEEARASVIRRWNERMGENDQKAEKETLQTEMAGRLPPGLAPNSAEPVEGELGR